MMYMIVHKIISEAPKCVKVIEARIDSSLQPDEVLVRNLYSFISTGTESRKIERGSFRHPPFPCDLGYSAVGEVTAVVGPTL